MRSKRLALAVPVGSRRTFEPLRRDQHRWPGLSKVLGNYGLLILTIILVVAFTFLLPTTFATGRNVRAILSDQSTTAFVCLAQMIPLSVAKFDLSLGYGLGLAQLLVIGLQVNSGLPWFAAVLVTCLIGLGWGTINGFLVEAAQIDSFIATLGTGSILYAFSFAYSGGAQITGSLPSGFLALNNASLFGIPGPAIYAVVLAILMWLAYEYLPIGRFMYAVGSNPRAAELTGIRRRRCVILAFCCSGFLAAVAGVLLASRLQVGQASVGQEYLLPSFVGALLGTTAFKPGRVNVWGTIIAVVVLAVGISGLEQLGSSFFVEPMFDGVTLLIAVALAGFTSRRKLRVRARAGPGNESGADVEAAASAEQTALGADSTLRPISNRARPST